MDIGLSLGGGEVLADTLDTPSVSPLCSWIVVGIFAGRRRKYQQVKRYNIQLFGWKLEVEGGICPAQKTIRVKKMVRKFNVDYVFILLG